MRLAFETGPIIGTDRAGSRTPEPVPPLAGPSAVPPPRSPPVSAPTPPATTDFTLSVDAQLRRLWFSQCEAALDGIAAARAGGSVTVIAVPRTTLGAYDGTMVKEALTKHFAAGSLNFLVLTATSYQDLVRTWFHQVDTGRARLVAVQSIDGDAVLRVVVDEVDSDGSGEPRIGKPADREALRALLPHERIELIPAERLAASGERYR